MKIDFAFCEKRRKTDFVNRSIRTCMGRIQKICVALGYGKIATGIGNYTSGRTPLVSVDEVGAIKGMYENQLAALR